MTARSPLREVTGQTTTRRLCMGVPFGKWPFQETLGAHQKRELQFKSNPPPHVCRLQEPRVL